MVMTMVHAEEIFIPDAHTENIDRYLSELEQQGLAGAVLIAKDGDIILSRGYGLAHRESNRPMTPDTVFTTGSITKQFTAAAILKLEEQGKLSVTDHITQYFENVPASKADITVHHLLTHSAGLVPAIGADTEVIARNEYIAKTMLIPLDFEPGETYQYSNVGYSLLAAIIEQVSGQSYEAYLKKYLFEPAGMQKTGYVLPNWQADELAHGYLSNGEDWGTLLDYPQAGDGFYWHLRGNGGMLSTSLDMYAWHQALLGDAILSEASKDKLYTPHISEGGDSYYGYGWVVLDTPQGQLITHNGGNGVFHSDFLQFLDADVVIYASSSAGKPDATRLSGQLARMMFDASYIPVTERTPVDLESLQTSVQGQRALKLIDMMAGATDVDIQRFIEESISARLLEQVSSEVLLEGMKDLQAELGAVDIQAVYQRGDALEFDLISKASGYPIMLILSFESEEPMQIVGIDIED